MNTPAFNGLLLPYQSAWLNDDSSLKMMEKSRQVGISYVDALHSVKLAATLEAQFDVWVSSRDEQQAKLYLEDCLAWARQLNIPAAPLGLQLLDPERRTSAHVLEFKNGRRIWCLSSNPNALAGKHGHVKLDEFALHPDQRLLYQVARPVTQWGGTLSIISTHRGANTVFNQLLREIREQGNPMGWSLHSVSVQRAVEEGIVEFINRKARRQETREQFLARLRRECIDEEQWLQEYCCVPADESAAFISCAMLDACEAPGCLRDFAYLESCPNPLYAGVDIARKQDLCVIDVGEMIGDIVWDRLRLELRGQTFAEIEEQLYRVLELSNLTRACIDATGLGMQLAERAKDRFGWRVEPVTFTSQVKEALAFGLRTDLEARRLRLDPDPRLRADLRALRKEVTLSGNLRFIGENLESHCDRTWAKALRQEAARNSDCVGAAVG